MNYSKYKMSFSETIISFTEYLAIAYLIAVLFYDNTRIMIAFIPGFPIFYGISKRKLIKKREIELKKQFCEMISAISTSLLAGLSMENSFEECLSDMKGVFGENSYIVSEISLFIQKLSVNKRVDEIMLDFANRSGLEEIQDFSIVITETMKCGGSVPGVINSTVAMMKQKMETENEIKAILNGKLLEQRIMCVVPFFIIAYLRISSGDFMNCLYHNFKGNTVMTLCLLIYAIAIYVSSRIVDISV